MTDSANDAGDAVAKAVWSLREGEAHTAHLELDERVIARITDGIYRQPASALRELISNAYDADATKVIIQTDAPRFDRIVIRDDGMGMSPDALAYLITHIGGSSKRTARGKQLGTVNARSVRKSPGGRDLIGKIGIGLFAISHLTQHFQIITKRRGDDFQTSAVVVLRTHTEENLEFEADAKFDAGSVTLTKEPSPDTAFHGTEIVLMNLRKAAKNNLGSLDRWLALDAGSEYSDGANRIEEPDFHVGRNDPGQPELFLVKPRLPWKEDDAPLEKFEALFDAVAERKKKSVGNPTLESAFDNYLEMLWIISLSVPVRYLEQHPFDVRESDDLGLFQISNQKRGQVDELQLPEGASVGEHLELQANESDPVGGFLVLIDGVELRHPIRLAKGRTARGRTDQPLMFLGRCKSPLANLPPTSGGGALEFEAYFYWNPVIVPKENNGILIRVNGASGTLFDESFLDYRVSELTRLRQIMAEVFVTKGLDPALNIDRESFNTTHPHYLYIREWIHRALRQITNRLKGIDKARLEKARDARVQEDEDRLTRLAEEVWTKWRGADWSPPKIVLIREQDRAALEESRLDDRIVIDLASVSHIFNREGPRLAESQIVALTTVLAAYGLIEELSYSRLQALLSDIYSIFKESGPSGRHS